MGFEMVRSSVYSVTQMKVSREEMYKAKRGGGGVAEGLVCGRGREKGACFSCQHLTYTAVALTWNDLLRLFAPFYLPLILYRFFDRW